jgi:superfamily II DNA or RNA helicase
MIKPHKHPEYNCTQSKHENVPSLPTRMLIVAPSGSGKTVLLVSLILDIYPKCFSRIYIFSPTVHVDRQWDVVKDFQKKVMGVDDKREQLYFDEFNGVDLQRIIQQQSEITKMAKNKDMKKLYQILIILG